MMALGLTASAKDGLSSAESQTAKNPAGIGTGPGTGAGAGQPVSRAGGRTKLRAKRWLEVGIASWYGLQFQGRHTAGGELFDMNLMTCAHPSLPMGTWLRVTNLKNRRTAFVRVNDRGPVVDGRIVDLSFAAAQRLGLAGVGKVRLEEVRGGDPVLDQGLVAQLQTPPLFEPLGM